MYFETRNLSALTVPSIRDIVEDERGYLWIATPGGLVRYDGIAPVPMDRKVLTELPSDDIRALEYDPATTELWIGTVAGLAVYDLTREILEPVEFHRIGKTGASLEVVDLEKSPDGRIFAVTPDGVYQSGRGAGMVEIPVMPRSEDVPARVADLTVDGRGRIWGAASDGLKEWNPETGQLEDSLDIPGIRTIRALDGILWIGGDRSIVYAYNPDEGSVRTVYPGGTASDFARDAEGTIWIAMNDSGLALYDPISGSVRSIFVDPDHPYSLPSRRVDCLMAGGSGHLWIGTVDAGLLSVDIGKTNHLAHTRRSGANSLPSGPIQVIREDSLGYIWAGSSFGGLARIDTVTGDIRQYVHDSDDFFSINSDSISAMIEDSFGRIWIGTDRGPVLYIAEVEGFEPPGGMMGGGWPDFRGMPVLAMAEGSDGRIWMSLRNGELYMLDPLERDYRVYSFSPASVPSVLLVDRFGSLWAGSRTNLRLFRSDGDLVRTWSGAEDDVGGVLDGGIDALFIDSGDRLWIGGPTGLAIYRRDTESFDEVNLPDELSIGVSDITEDSAGDIWVSNGRELHVFDVGEQYLTTMGIDCGFTPSGYISELGRNRNGDVLVGANGEVWSYDRWIGKRDIDPPRAYLTGVKVSDRDEMNGREAARLDILDIYPGDNMFRIEYGAVDFRYRSRVVYEHRLTGVDRDWVGSDEANMVMYSKLAPGDYTFVVRAIDEASGVRGPETELEIRIAKSWWLQWWSIVVYGMVTAGLVTVIVKLREGRLLKDQVQVLEEARSKVMEANRKLEFLTMNDSLTGLLNRRGFDQAIDHALTTAHRNDLMISVFMLDVDFFKPYNDNYGHVKGDEVLRNVGKALRSVFERSTDIIARYGGEEFSVVFIGENPNATVTLANDLILAIQDLGIIHEYSAASDLLTLSAGSATIRAHANVTAEDLIRISDQALYAAKDGGRKRVCFTGIIPELPEVMKNGTPPMVLNSGDDG